MMRNRLYRSLRGNRVRQRNSRAYAQILRYKRRFVRPRRRRR